MRISISYYFEEIYCNCNNINYIRINHYYNNYPIGILLIMLTSIMRIISIDRIELPETNDIENSTIQDNYLK